MQYQQRTLSPLKKHFGKALLLTGLSVFTTTNLLAQTYAPSVTNPFNASGAGSAVKPTFVDLDNDGDLDIMTGTNYGSNGTAFYYLQNTGTNHAPDFAPGILDPFGSGDFYIGAFLSPAFADLDNDGDLDMMTGRQDGSSVYLENTGTAESPMFAEPVIAPFGLSNVGYLSSHTFTDLDNDGDLDVLIGEYYGNLFYFPNTGTVSAPAFGPNSNFPFGLSNVGTAVKPVFVDMDLDGDKDILAGVENGNHVYFQNTGTIAAPAFAAPVINPFGLTPTPTIYCGSSFGDLDFDGDLDIISGDNSAVLKYYQNMTPVPAPGDPANTTPSNNLLVCNGTSATLTASGVATGTLSWYDAPTGGNYLGSGSPFITAPLTASTTIYVQDSTAGGTSSNRIPVVLSVAAPINELTMAVTQTTFCESGQLSILLQNTQTNLAYTLRNDLNDTIIHGPVSGSNGIIYFTTAVMTTTTTYNVLAHYEPTASLVCEKEMAQQLTITINQPAMATVPVSLCYGQDYTYADGTVAAGITADESHVSTLTGQAANSCDSIVTENIVSLPLVTGALNPVVCHGETFIINGMMLSEASPLGEMTLENAAVNGCDSVVTITLTVLPELAGTITNTICANEEIIVNGTVYNAANPSGTEVFANIGANGCDSTVTIDLNVLPALTGTYATIICPDEQLTINGTVYGASHLTGTEVFTAMNGCDSTVTVTLSLSMSMLVGFAPGMPGWLEAQQSGAGYQWIDCSTNQPIPGATSQSFTATVNGSYAVIITMNSCTDTSMCVTPALVSLDEMEQALITLYPNPAEALFSISGLEKLSGISAINILDVNGKMVGSIDPVELTGDVSAIVSGIYFVQIVHAKGIETIKLIKK